MGFLSPPKMPDPPKVTPLPPAPRKDDAQQDAANQKRQLRAASGFSSTVTGASSNSNTVTTRKLLGYG